MLLAKLGHRAGASTIRRALRALRIPPAPKPNAGMTRRQFPHAQATTILATGFFHLDRAVTPRRRSCPFRHRSQPSVRPLPRSHRPPGRTADQPADPHPPDGHRRSPRGPPDPGPGPRRAVHRNIRRGPGERGHHRREDPAPKPARMLTPTDSCSPPGPRPPTRC